MKTIFSNSKYKKQKWVVILSFVILLVISTILFFNKTASVTASTTIENINTNISFKNDIQPIFERRCIKCHGGEFPSEGLNMESYESLIAGSQSGQVIVVGDANNSLIIEMLENGEMPKRGQDLTSEQIELIRQWINEGALNN